MLDVMIILVPINQRREVGWLIMVVSGSDTMGGGLHGGWLQSIEGHVHETTINCRDGTNLNLCFLGT